MAGQCRVGAGVAESVHRDAWSIPAAEHASFGAHRPASGADFPNQRSQGVYKLQNSRRSHAMGECTIFLCTEATGCPCLGTNSFRQCRFHIDEFDTDDHVHVASVQGVLAPNRTLNSLLRNS